MPLETNTILELVHREYFPVVRGKIESLQVAGEWLIIGQVKNMTSLLPAQSTVLRLVMVLHIYGATL